MTLLTIVAASVMFAIGSVLIMLGIGMLGWVLFSAFGQYFTDNT